MRCPIDTRENAEFLLAYCSRKLDAASAAILEDHIRICPACREFARGQQAVWEALDTWRRRPSRRISTGACTSGSKKKSPGGTC